MDLLAIYLDKIINMNKICIISGGTSGLGLEIAELLIKEGKKVLILGRNNDKIANAIRRLKKVSGADDPMALSCNIGHESDIQKVGQYLSEKKLSVEYLFNNAGIGNFKKAEATSEEMVDNVFAANLKGMILLTSEILRLTPEESELTIVNIMSTSALLGRPDETIYCAAKWGARGYTEALRAEFKGRKRNIIAVYPGGMRTDFWKMQGPDKDLSTFMDPALVADKVVHAVLLTDKTLVTDITINRK